MKIVEYTEYGPPEVLKLREVPRPQPRHNEVLVKVHATSVTIGDTIMRGFSLPGPSLIWLVARLYLGLRKPKRSVLGMELAGVVEAVGSSVRLFKPGDAVFASTFAANFGGYAEYKCLPESGVIAPRPEGLSFVEAAAIVGGGQTALQCLKKARIQPGQKVLVYGASGAVGTNAVQIARQHFGAEVTGVCSTTNVELVKSLGATKVIDYTREDFTLRDERYDVVFDAVGKLSRTQKKAARRLAGVYLSSHVDSAGGDKAEHLRELKELVDAGKLKPVIDRVYPLEQIVEAHRYVELGHKRGNVGITLTASSA